MRVDFFLPSSDLTSTIATFKLALQHQEGPSFYPTNYIVSVSLHLAIYAKFSLLKT